VNEDSDAHASANAMRKLASECLRGLRIGQAIYVAVKLGIPDLLRSGKSRSCHELAQATKTNPAFLYRLLRTLASVDILTYDSNSNACSLSALGDNLRSDSKESLRATVLLTLGGEMSTAWNNLEYNIRTGRIAFDHIYGMRDWEFWERNQEQGEIFNGAMSDTVKQSVKSLVESYSFSQVSKIVDIAGGDGTLLISLLKEWPNLQGIIVDLPHVTARTRANVVKADMVSRCEVIEGNILTQDLPRGGDIYILSRIIHDWNDEDAVRILSNCNRAMEKGKKILLVERFLPSTIEKSSALEFACLSDLNTMVMNGGLERTLEELSVLLSAAGFRLEKVVPIENHMIVIEGIRV
jgi:ubiquinone/menaquinone biosynthesis C-methylase UbiE